MNKKEKAEPTVNEVFLLLSEVSEDNKQISRTYGALKRAGVQTREQLGNLGRDIYIKYLGIGQKSVLLIEAAKELL